MFRFSVPFLPPYHFWYLPFQFLTTLAFLNAVALQAETVWPSLSLTSLPSSVPLLLFFIFSIIINMWNIYTIWKYNYTFSNSLIVSI